MLRALLHGLLLIPVLAPGCLLSDAFRDVAEVDAGVGGGQGGTGASGGAGGGATGGTGGAIGGSGGATGGGVATGGSAGSGALGGAAGATGECAGMSDFSPCGAASVCLAERCSSCDVAPGTACAMAWGAPLACCVAGSCAPCSATGGTGGATSECAGRQDFTGCGTASVCLSGQCASCSLVPSTACRDAWGAGRACCGASGSCEPCGGTGGTGGTTGTGGTGGTGATAGTGGTGGTVASPWGGPTLDATGNTTCAVHAGELRCWGANHARQLATAAEDTLPHPTPAPVSTEIVSTVAVGVGHACAVFHPGGAASPGELRCWGSNTYGQLGCGACAPVMTGIPTAVSLTAPPVRVAAGMNVTCGIFGAASAAHCWGDNTAGELGVGTAASPIATPTPVSPSLSGLVLISALGHQCASSATTSWCWGENASGQIGNGSIAVATAPAELSAPGLVEVAAGFTHTCGRWSNGDVRCWGSNDQGQLGVDPATAPMYDAPPVAMVPIVTGALQVAAGGKFSCALRSGGTVWCWGGNDMGQLGQGTPELWRWQPGQVGPPAPPFQNVQAIALAARHACALKSDGSIACWGANDFGQTGEATTAGPGGRTQFPTEVVFP